MQGSERPSLLAMPLKILEKLLTSWDTVMAIFELVKLESSLPGGGTSSELCEIIVYMH